MSFNQRYIEANILIKAIEILPNSIHNTSLSENYRADLIVLLGSLQREQVAIKLHQETFPNQDRRYPIKLNDRQHRFLMGI